MSGASWTEDIADVYFWHVMHIATHSADVRSWRDFVAKGGDPLMHLIAGKAVAF